jgi:hypothetical protein
MKCVKALLLFTMASGCVPRGRAPEGPSFAPAPAVVATPVTSPAPEPTPPASAPASNVCSDLVEDYRRTLARSTSCRTDSDCTLIGRLGLDNAVDPVARSAAPRFDALRERWNANQCTAACAAVSAGAPEPRLACIGRNCGFQR